MDRFWTFKLFVAVSLLGGVCHCWGVNVQQRVNAIKGSCVVVPCTTVSHNKVAWYKYQSRGYPVVYSGDRSEIIDQFRGRTSVPGNAREGNCALKIDNVRQEDGEVELYVWIWTNTENKGFYDTREKVKLNVLEPEAPQIYVEKAQVEGKAFKATCTLRNSCPMSPPPISWTGLNPASSEVTHTDDSLRVTATFTVTRQMQGTSLSCRATMQNGRTLSSTAVSLDVYYAPTEVKIDYTGSSSVIEGDTISLSCTSKAKPEPTQYEWLVTQNGTVVRHKGRTVVLENVRRDTYVSCIVTNSVGQGESKKQPLTVHYAPTEVKIDYTGSSSVIEGDTISLSCTSKAKPEPTQYEWLVTQNGIVVRHKGRTVVLQNVRRDTYVSCIVRNSVGQGESKKQPLTVHYAPTEVKIDYTGSSSVIEGDTISLSCTSKAKPEPTVYEWLITQNGIVVHHKGKSVVLQNVRRDTYVSCTVTNSVGQGESKKQPLTVHYHPSILPGSFCSTQSGTVKCVCQSEANPSAEIFWTIDGSSALFPPFNTTTHGYGSTTVSELTGPQGYNVNCTATNSVGIDFTQIPVHSEEANSGVLVAVVAGVLAAVVFIIVCAVFIICKKRRHAEPHDLSTVQTSRPDKVSHDYGQGSFEDIYVNTVHGQPAYKSQDEDPSIYANYDKMS